MTRSSNAARRYFAVFCDLFLTKKRGDFLLDCCEHNSGRSDGRGSTGDGGRGCLRMHGAKEGFDITWARVKADLA